MTDLFNNYEKVFQERIFTLEKHSTINLSEIQELEDILEQMQMEVHSKPLYKAKLRLYRSQLTKLKKQQLTITCDTVDNNDYDKDNDDDRRQRLLNNTERLQNSSQRLEDTRRVALETESMGADILQQLKTQRETMTRTRDTVSETDSYLDKASKTLKSMSRRYF
ncbi:snare region anchored in the vesicle membrane C-terminus-domain-containing protein [Circinella umbellata]|nr:snare region anchored in the vesicle membrane C-terminus-domain-containing protein [Circinella umbellata]